jgi:hypothetical protein
VASLRDEELKVKIIQKVPGLDLGMNSLREEELMVQIIHKVPGLD